jgi:uncharacterized protein
MTKIMWSCGAVVGALLVGCAGAPPPAAVVVSAPAPGAVAAPGADVDASPSAVDAPGAGLIHGAAQMCGEGTVSESRRALYARGCVAGDADSCGTLGLVYVCGAGVEANAASGRAMMQKACDTGSNRACYSLGSLLVSGSHMPQDVTAGVTALDTGCTRGHMESCEASGVLRMATSSLRVQRHGMTLLGKACQGGAAEACANAAVAYVGGIGGVVKDEAKAFGLATRACENKSLFGCFVLASMLVEGKGTEKNAARGAALFGAACEAGRADGCLGLAKCQYLGLGVKEDKVTAIANLRRACAGNNGEACRLLADAGDAHAAFDPNGRSSSAAAATPSDPMPVGPGVF